VNLRGFQLVMRLLAKLGVQIASKMLALEVVRESNACLAYRAELAAAFRDDLVFVWWVPGQKHVLSFVEGLFGLRNDRFGGHDDLNGELNLSGVKYSTVVRFSGLHLTIPCAFFALL
jgi:hypothetical protein